MILLPVHVLAGMIGIIAGFVALYAIKGAKLHRNWGMLFVYAMLVMSGLGAGIAFTKHQPGSVLGGSLTFYLVSTGLLTVRRNDLEFHWVDAGGFLVAVAVGALGVKFGLAVLNGPTHSIDGVPAGPGFVFGQRFFRSPSASCPCWRFQCWQCS